MTTTHPDLAALLAAVCQLPDDDTPRLVLADWLDEHDGKVPCEVCVRKGCECPQHVPNRYTERAEFIRVQCELVRLHDAGHGSQPENGPACPVLSSARKNPRAGGQVMPKCRSCERAFEVEQRECELLTDDRRAEWFGIKCPACGGPAETNPWAAFEDCDLCKRTGFALVEFRRGFVERVTCRMGDVIASHDTPRGPVYALTPWARGVLAAHPVTRWEIVDREPVENAGEWAFATRSLPDPVREVMRLTPPHSEWFSTRDLARDALALAVGRVARRLAGLPEVTP